MVEGESAIGSTRTLVRCLGLWWVAWDKQGRAGGVSSGRVWMPRLRRICAPASGFSMRYGAAHPERLGAACRRARDGRDRAGRPRPPPPERVAVSPSGGSSRAGVVGRSSAPGTARRPAGGPGPGGRAVGAGRRGGGAFIEQIITIGSVMTGCERDGAAGEARVRAGLRRAAGAGCAPGSARRRRAGLAPEVRWRDLGDVEAFARRLLTVLPARAPTYSPGPGCRAHRPAPSAPG
ncbi:hypothetical protein SANTM175S_07086 [Streptomyces antimycoticus]